MRDILSAANDFLSQPLAGFQGESGVTAGEKFRSLRLLLFASNKEARLAHCEPHVTASFGYISHRNPPPCLVKSVLEAREFLPKLNLFP